MGDDKGPGRDHAGHRDTLDETGEDVSATLQTRVEVPKSRRPPAAATGELKQGSLLGRFVILETIGTGAMGAVYAAFDPKLGRKVALKSIRGDVKFQPTLAARSRMIREAKALAQLSHPNVVTVYDVDVVDDEVFIAMEHVSGQTLTEWLEASERSWREIIQVMLGAGRGLAAAHAAGLIHRDFKPDNVLIGEDGRVRVTDFGLVRSAQEETEEIEEEAQSAAPGARGEIADTAPDPAGAPSLTQTGTVLGTPEFMSPEQFLGKPADPRSDIFCFCVSLCRALYRQKPFHGETYEELFISVTRGELRDPPREARVPRRIRRAMLRGLATSPEERFANLEQLLQELSRSTRPVRLWTGAALLAVAGLGVGVLVTRPASAPPICAGSARRLEGIWDAGRRADVEAAFEATGAPFAGEAYSAVAESLDTYAHDWASMHKEACEATHVRGEQSDEMLDLRMLCLNQRRNEMKALVEVLSHADAQVVGHAAQAGLSLTNLGECADVEALLERRELPEGEAEREKIRRLRREIGKVKAMRDVGRFADGIELAEPAVKAANAIGYEPLEAEALFLLGQLQWQSGKINEAESSLTAAAEAGEAGRDERRKVQAWIELVEVVGYEHGRPREAERWAGLARAGLERLGGDELLEARLLTHRGTMLFRAGRYQESVESFEKGLALRQKLLGPDHYAVGQLLGHLGNAYLKLGKIDQALDLQRRAVAVREQALGSRHPDVAESVNNLGNALATVGRLDEAKAQYQRALSIWRDAFGEDHPRVAVAIANLGSLAALEGDLDGALERLKRALAIETKVLGLENPAVADTLNTIGKVQVARGEYAEADKAYKKALEVTSATFGPMHPNAAESLKLLGFSLIEQEDYASAVPALRRAIDIWHHRSSPGAELAEAQFALARALWHTGSRTEARDLAREAKETFQKSGPVDREEVDEVTAWLKEAREAVNR